MTSDNFNELLQHLFKNYPEHYAKYHRNFMFSDSGLQFSRPATMTDEENKELDDIIDKWATEHQYDTKSCEQ